MFIVRKNVGKSSFRPNQRRPRRKMAIFPKKMPLSERLGAWLFLWFACTVVFHYLIRSLSIEILYGAFLILFYGSFFFSVDYHTRKAEEVFQWTVILISSGFFFLFLAFAESLIVVYLNWFILAPFFALGVTSLVLGLLLFCGIVSNWSLPHIVRWLKVKLKESNWFLLKEAEA